MRNATTAQFVGVFGFSIQHLGHAHDIDNTLGKEGFQDFAPIEYCVLQH